MGFCGMSHTIKSIAIYSWPVVEVGAWVSNYIPLFKWTITYPCLKIDVSLNMASEATSVKSIMSVAKT